LTDQELAFHGNLGILPARCKHTNVATLQAVNIHVTSCKRTNIGTLQAVNIQI